MGAVPISSRVTAVNFPTRHLYRQGERLSIKTIIATTFLKSTITYFLEILRSL